MRNVFSKLPRRVLVEGVSYKISYSDHVMANGHKAWGYCDIANKNIKVKNGPTRMVLEKTLIHEMLHAMSEECDFELSEKKVRQLENALYRMLSDNNWKIAIDK